MQVWITRGDHFRIPGHRLTVSSTEERATVDAVGMVGIMMEDSDIKDRAVTRDNWKDCLARLQARYGEDECDVWIEAHDLQA